MGLSEQFDVGKRLKAYAGVPLTSTPTPSSSGGVAQNGATIDRQGLARHYYSCRSVGHGRLVGSTVQAVTVAMSFQHSSDGTSWDNFSTDTNASAAIGSTGATGAQAVEGVAEQAVNLRSARRYVRQVLTPTFASATSGDVAYFSGEVVFGGADELPSS